jgi:HAD superfamily hydrolase (TIGR01509 family)
MRGIIFDMDGVLIDSMPFHAEAMRIAIKEATDHEINKKNIFLLEGMPTPDLLKEIFMREKINIDDILVTTISKRKKELFKQIEDSRTIAGAKELIDDDLKNCSCLKALVSGSSRNEIIDLLDKNIGSKNFDLIISGDDIKEGKPDPSPFQTALERMKLKSSEAIVVENSPLGIEAAIRAGIKFIITLNNTPLDVSSDFKGLISVDKGDSKILFKDTESARSFLMDWCCSS